MAPRTNWIWQLIALVVFAIVFWFTLSYGQHTNIWDLVRKLKNPPAANASIITHQPICLLLPERDAIPPTDEEDATTGPCTFKGAICDTEAGMHKLVRRFLESDSIVMEIGARYGTTSCVIAHIQKNSGHLIAVEPDITVVPTLIANQISHFCKFHVVAAAISEKPVYLLKTGRSIYDGYRTLMSPIMDKNADSSALPKIHSFSWESIERAVNLKVDTLVIDCEGCAIPFFEEYFHRKQNQLKAVFLEVDDPIEEHNKWLEEFQKIGFTVFMDNEKRHTAITRQNVGTQ